MITEKTEPFFNNQNVYYQIVSNKEFNEVIERNNEGFIPDRLEDWSLKLLNIEENNSYFLEYLKTFSQIAEIDFFLEKELLQYKRRKKGQLIKSNYITEFDLDTIINIRSGWIKHTIFICKNEFAKTGLETYNIVVKWCNNFNVSYLDDDAEGTEEFNKNGKNSIDTSNFENLFINPDEAISYLKVLQKIEPNILDINFNYIGKNKGVFPLWVKLLRSANIIQNYTDVVYKDFLNNKINNLNLSKDASEFRKTYSRIDNSDIETDLKALFSQISQKGK